MCNAIANKRPRDFRVYYVIFAFAYTVYISSCTPVHCVCVYVCLCECICVCINTEVSGEAMSNLEMFTLLMCWYLSMSMQPTNCLKGLVNNT